MYFYCDESHSPPVEYLIVYCLMFVKHLLRVWKYSSRPDFNFNHCFRKCPLCNFKSNYQSSIIGHLMQRHQNSFPTSSPSQSPSQSPSYSPVRPTTEPPIQAESATQTTITTQDMATQTLDTCKICDYVSDRPSNLRWHMEQKHTRHYWIWFIPLRTIHLLFVIFFVDLASSCKLLAFFGTARSHQTTFWLISQLIEKLETILRDIICIISYMTYLIVQV